MRWSIAVNFENAYGVTFALFLPALTPQSINVTPQLPCGHKYCASCMAQLREKGVAQTCPLCREPLPPGPDKLYDLGSRIYDKIMAAVDPGCNADWDSIS